MSTANRSTPLPYDGNIQEAMRKKDREAIKYLMTQKKYDSNNDEFSETKSTSPDISIKESLVALGFSEMQVMDYINSSTSPAAAVKRLLECERHFPSPPHKSSVTNKVSHSEESRVTSHMLRGLDPESTWALLQCCVDNPNATQMRVYEILSLMGTLCAVHILPSSACKWVRELLVRGYISEVECVLETLDRYRLLSDFSPVVTPSEKGSSDHLLLSYTCPITREILVEPVTLQCGHNFSRTALEESVRSGNRTCPICKASVQWTEFAVNVVLRDTIERLYPHVLLRRAVDDIQAAQKSGIRELRSVMRWLQNFPQTPEVVHAVITAISSWIHENDESKGKIISEGHVATLCKIFNILDVNSATFVELLSVLSALCCEVDSSSSAIATSSMLTADIHVDLMKILDYKINATVDKDGLQLLMRLLESMDDTHLKRFVMSSNSAVSVLAPDGQDHNSQTTLAPPDFGASMPTSHFTARSERNEDRLCVLFALLCERIDMDSVVVVIFDLCIRLITYPSFTEEERLRHVEHLISAGVINGICSCLKRHYLQPTYVSAPHSVRLSSEDGNCDIEKRTVLKCVVLLAKLSVRAPEFQRFILLEQCSSYCLDILKTWRIRGEQYQEISCDILFATCEAVAGMVFGCSSPAKSVGATENDFPLKTQLGQEELRELKSMLEYRWKLSTTTQCCDYICPNMEPLALRSLEKTGVEVRVDKHFAMIRRSSKAPPQPYPSIIKVSLLARPYSTCPSYERPRIIAPDSPNDLSVSITVNSHDIDVSCPIQIVIVRNADTQKFYDWSMGGNCLPFGKYYAEASLPPIPFMKVDVRTGTILRSGVQTLCHSKGCTNDSWEGAVVEEYWPLSLSLEDTKHYRVDMGGFNSVLSMNGHNTPVMLFPDPGTENDNKTGESGKHCAVRTLVDRLYGDGSDQQSLADRYEEKNSTEGEERDAMTDSSQSASETVTRSVTRAIEPQVDSAERFLSSVIAAVASEHPMLGTTPGHLSESPPRVSSHLTSGSGRRRPTPVIDTHSSEHNTTGDSSEEDLAILLVYPPFEKDQHTNVLGADIAGTNKSAVVHVACLDERAPETPSSDDCTTTLLPTIWQYFDDRYLRTSHGSNQVIFSTTHPVNDGIPLHAYATSTPTYSGLHTYCMRMMSIAGPVSIGLCSSDEIPSTYCDSSTIISAMSIFSLVYSSGGSIDLTCATGISRSASCPPLKSGDCVEIHLVQEGSGNVRVFHNNSLVFVAECFLGLLTEDVGISAYLSLSHPGDTLHLEHSTCDTSDTVNWKWLYECFSHLSNVSYSNDECENLMTEQHADNTRVVSYLGGEKFMKSYSSEDIFSLVFTLVNAAAVVCKSSMEFSILSRMLSEAQQVVSSLGNGSSIHDHCNDDISRCIAVEFDTCHCIHDSTSPCGAVSSSWCIKCPLAHDVRVSLVQLFSVANKFASNEIMNSDMSMIRFKLSSLALSLVVCDRALFPPSVLLNSGLGHVLSQCVPATLSNISHHDMRTAFNVIEFVKCVLNCSVHSNRAHMSRRAATWMLFSSGIVYRLGALAYSIICIDESQVEVLAQRHELSERIAVLIGELLRRAGGAPAMKILDYPSGGGELLDEWGETPDALTLTLMDENKYLDVVQKLVESYKWHCVIAHCISSRIGLVPEISFRFEEDYLPTVLGAALLGLCQGGTRFTMPSLTSVCFDFRTQSSAHIWHKQINGGGGNERSFGLPKSSCVSTAVRAEELTPVIAVSSGDASRLLSDNPEEYWASDGCVCPHWIDVMCPRESAWMELLFLQHMENDSHSPNFIRVKVGATDSDLVTVKEVTLDCLPEWQVVLSRNEIDWSGIKMVNEIMIRVEILSTFRPGYSARIARIKLMGLPVSPLTSEERDSSPIIFLDALRPRMKYETNYKAATWQESLFFALLDGSTRAMESLISGHEMQCNSNVFSGYGPWLWGHPGNPGCIGLTIPCSALSAVSQMLECGLSSIAVQKSLKRAISIATEEETTHTTGSGTEDENEEEMSVRSPVSRLAVSDVANLIAGRYSRMALSLASVGSSVGRSGNPGGNLASLSSSGLSAATAATIAAIRTLVQEEQMRMLHLPQNVGLNADRIEESWRNIRHNSELLNSRLRGDGPGNALMSSVPTQIPPPGPSVFLYKMANGSDATFDASYEACSPFGLLHGQTVKSHRYPEIGVGTVIGVRNGYIWIHLEKNVGATYRRDNWQFVDIYVVEMATHPTSQSVATQMLLSSHGQTIKTGDRVRRGRNWQWHNQDGYAGNLGTVVDGAGSDLWVSVEWDGGGRNTYRWGAEGQYDLEIVRGRDQSSSNDGIVVSESSNQESDNQCAPHLHVNETLTAAERIRSTLWTSDNYGHLVSELWRDSIRRGHSELFRRCLRSVCALASYNIDSARSLCLRIDDIAFLMRSICSEGDDHLLDATDVIDCGKLLSVLCSSGILLEICRKPVEDIVFPFLQMVHALRTYSPCGLPVLCTLRFLRELLWMGLSSSQANAYSRYEGSSRSDMECDFKVQQDKSQMNYKEDAKVDHSSRQNECVMSYKSDLNYESVNEVSACRAPRNEDSNIHDTDIARLVNSCLLDRSTMEELFDILVPVLRYRQSAGAIALAIDAISYLLMFSESLNLLLSRNIESVLVTLARQLNEVQPSASVKFILELVMDMMLRIERRSPDSVPTLLSAILEFANSARDFETVVQVLRSHSNDSSTVCRCIEILIGGRRRYQQKKTPSSTWRNDLVVGDKVDAKDKSHQWYESVIRNVNEKGEVFVHYMGWGAKYDEWIPRMSDRLQIIHSETGYWRDNLRLDDPVEILCLHHEGSEVKRRWFRGVVTQMDGADRLLIEYDKRGSREERWVSLRHGEEICKVGTHVPSTLGPSSDIHKTVRKKRLVACNTCAVLLNILDKHTSNIEVARASLEALQYIISDDDIASKFECMASHDPAKVLCKCVAFYAKRVGEIHTLDGMDTASEDIVETACSLLALLCTSQDTENFAVGDVIDAQWRRRGNQAFPGRISRVRDDGMTFDITYDDGDHEERVGRDRISHRHGACYYNALSFVQSIISCDGHLVLIDLIKSYGEVHDRLILIPVLSILASMIEMGDGPRVADLVVQSDGHVTLTEILKTSIETKSSARLVVQCLTLLRLLSDTHVDFKEAIYNLGIQTMCMQCISAFLSQPNVLAASLGMLTATISKDGAYHYPTCMTSSGVVDFRKLSGNDIYTSFWQSEDRQPSENSPHWIDIKVDAEQKWRELSILLRDYGSASPDSIVVKYKFDDGTSDPCSGGCQFFEVKRFAPMERVGGWTSVVSCEEISDSYQKIIANATDRSVVSSGFEKASGVIRVEITHNYNDGKCSYVGGLRLLLERDDHCESVDNEEKRKDALAEMDGVSMIVECLLQSKTNDRDLYHSGRAFLQAFATNDQRAQFVVDCGGGYIL